jgi:hypothetical protein
MSSRRVWCFFFLAFVALPGCERSDAPTTAPTTDPVPNSIRAPAAPTAGKAEPTAFASIPSQGLFTDVTQAIGIENASEIYPDGQFLTPEITPGGVALFDYDNDGDLDLYQVCHCPPGSFDQPAPNRLYQQRDDGKLVEVPGAGGLADPGFGHGVAVGDVDNDGDRDVFVTNYGADHLYINNGDATFQDVTQSAGLTSEHHWSSSAAFLDYDRDGDLDLYAVRFAKFDSGKICKAFADDTEREYCGPHVFPPDMDVLYRNNGDGTFSDVTAQAGIDVPGRGWGIVCADMTRDGWVDIYIANDEEPAQLWVNGQDGTFSDQAIIRGVAFNRNGRVEAGMGLAVGDANNDGLLDLFKTHISGQTNTLYLALDKEAFADQTPQGGMAAIDLPYTGWGCGFFDYDHDGDLDLAVVNGRVAIGPVHPRARLGPFWNRFAEPNLLFANDGTARFADVTSQAGPFGTNIEVSRGLAFGDLDGDGDVDLVVNHVDNSLRVYRNDAPARGTHWLAVSAKTGRRDAIGAEITLVAGNRRWLRLANPGFSFLSSNDPRAHFGLGAIDKVDALEVLWPDGQQERFPVPAVDTHMTIQQGSGR